MKLTDMIDDVLRKVGVPEEEIAFARRTALAVHCPEKCNLDMINYEIPEAMEDIFKGVIALSLLEFMNNDDFRKALRKKTTERMKNN